MSEELVKKPETSTAIKAQVDKQFIDQSNKFLSALGTPEKVERWKTLLAMEMYRRPELMECDAPSIIASAIEAATFGLEFGPRGHSYIIPRKKKATFAPSYKGLVYLAKQSGVVEQIEAQVVRKDDDFSYELGLNKSLKHIPSNNPGDVIFAYAIVRFTSGSHDFEVMTRVEIDGIRKRSTSANGPWSTDYNEMAKKTVIRRLCKRLDFGDAFADAMAHDDHIEEDAPAAQNMTMPEATA